MPTKRGTSRPTAEERREQVLEAGIQVFSEYGYHAAKTADIARLAGISQPYVYALFDDKKALFLACLKLSRERIQNAFTEAWEPGGTPEETLAVLGRNYRRLLDDTASRRCQLQGFAASADPEIRESVRRGFIEMADMLGRMTGADRPTVARFMAAGQLLNLGSVLDLPSEYVEMRL